MLTSCPHLLPRLRISGAVPLLSPYVLTAWTETNNFTLRTEWVYVELVAGLRAFTENTVFETFVKYRVIHKSVKHLKNLQQMGYATDHGNSYVDRERNC